MSETLNAKRRKESNNQIVPVLIKSEINGGLGRFFMNKKIASQERIVLVQTKHNHQRRHKQDYFLFKQDDHQQNSFTVVKGGFEIQKDQKLMNQLVVNGYFILRSPTKITLLNPEINETIVSLDLPIPSKSFQYIGSYGGVLTLVSLEIMDDAEHTVESIKACTFGTQTWNLVKTEHKFTSPYGGCLSIGKNMYFLANTVPESLYANEQVIVASFDLIDQTIELLEVPTALNESAASMCLVNIQEEAGIVDFMDLHEDNGIVKVWIKKDKTWELWQTFEVEKAFWKGCFKKNGYCVSNVTSKGQFVLSPSLIAHKMRQEQPMYVFLYDIHTQKGKAINISETKLKKKRYITTRVDYVVEEAEDINHG
ncbi:unnamed protein product [Cochlearia groenlandica]